MHTDRRTGQSTAIALETIARAIQQPHKKVRIVDHHPTVEANRFLANTIANVIGRLGLEHLHVNYAEMTLVFERRVKP